MKKISLILITLSITLFGCKNEKQIGKGDKNIEIYKYTYQHNTQNLNEDHYIVLESNNKSINGWYYGTSDDFDEAREGYLPGFFVKEMDELIINNNTIKFKLNVKFEDCYRSSIPLQYRNSDELPKTFKIWDVGGITFNPKSYEGTIVNGKIILKNAGFERIFYKIIK